MAPVKRKGNDPDESSATSQKKRVKTDGEKTKAQENGRPDGAKKKKQENKLNAVASDSAAAKTSVISVLRDEAPAFPRGGASVLTPLERKQIQIQAKRDVLFEQSGGGGGGGGEKDSEISDIEQDGEHEEAAQPATTKAKRKKKSKGQTGHEDSGKQGVKIEGLNFKRIVPGSKILGQVSAIGTQDVAIALPNNLTGYVPWRSISQRLTERIEGLLNREDKESDEEQDTDDDDQFDLKHYLQVGQYLRVLVASTTSDSANSKGKKHLELSITPQDANSGLSKSDMVVNSTVQAAVLSVEDHGLVMDLGLEDKGTRGFMSSKELPPGLKPSQIKEGAVFLCIVTGHNASGTVVKLSANLQNAGSIKKSHFLSNAPTINTFLPGTAAEILLTEVTAVGMAGKIMGMLDTTVDLVHSGSADGQIDLTKKYHTGAKIRGRIISTYPTADPLKVGFSLLDHVLKFTPTALDRSSLPEDTPSISAIIPEVKVVRVDPGFGLYVQLDSTKHQGFVHISKVADGKVDTLSPDVGPYKVGSTHEGRIVGFNALDNLYLLSFERKVIDQPFLRLEDVTVGTVVKGKIDKLLIGPEGINGLIVSLADGISGLVPGMHMADTKLQHPEKKFREGMQVTVRILSVDLEKRQLRLTLKKSLLHSESAIWKDYEDISPGSQSPGTLINIQPNGAVVQFYGAVRGFLPVSEMSEAYIKDPSQHFSVGQVVNVHALSVDRELGRLVVSCKDPSAATESYKAALDKLHPGVLVSGTVFEKSSDDVLLKLEESGLIARLNSVHVADGAASRNGSALARVRVGQKMHDLLILDIKKAHRLIQVTNKPSLKHALQKGMLPAKFEDVEEGSQVTGIVKNVTPDGIFVLFMGGLTGLVPKRFVDDERLTRPDFGFITSQTITARVASVDSAARRFYLSLKPDQATSQQAHIQSALKGSKSSTLSNPVDENLKSIDDLVSGKVTKARITSVKDTQLNMQLADNVQGRIDVSEVFDKWEDIKDRKHPLRFFRAKQVLPVRVLGIHDARSHKFLPISHRSGKVPVFELSAKPSTIEAKDFEPLTLEKIPVGSSWIAFVNNITDDCLWLNLSPNVRGRMRVIDLPDELTLTGEISKNLPVGSALRVNVSSVDADKNRLDLTTEKGSSLQRLTFSDVSRGMILLGRVTKVTERQVLVQINDNLVGAIGLIDMADDYSKANPANFRKNELLRVCVVDVDAPNKKMSLSVRPSKVLSSSLTVEDPEITSIEHLKVNDIVRGFVRRVADIGLFVTLGHNVTAYVRVSDLSDSYLKEWQDEYQVDQLVKGRITLVDVENNKIQMSLKQSVLDPNYKPPMTLKDLKPGQTVTGKVRRVEEFGAFITIDGTANLSGLCHRTEMADAKVPDARKLYEKDDIVKAKVLKVDLEKEQISLGLKASYFKEDELSDESESDEADDEEDREHIGGVDLEMDSDDDASMGGVDLPTELLQTDANGVDDDIVMADAEDTSKGGLITGGFDWTGNTTNGVDDGAVSGSDSDEERTIKKRKRRKPEIQIDRTGDLDANGPQSVADYERLLLGEPDSSLLWLKYMAFQLDLGEVDKAREIAERALRSISIGQETEKLNVWIGLLNLENTFGTDETLEDVFKRACQYNDPQEIYERMASIYIQSGKTEKADELFQAALKKKFTQAPNLWLNYANFLFDTMAAPERGRALLPRALQSLPPHTHVEVTSKFGQLEFRSPNGDVERGRTIFEGLLSSFPKRVDLWIVLLDLEIKHGDADQVRRLFERALGLNQGVAMDGTKTATKRKLKDKQAKFLFKKWLAFEESIPDNEKRVDEVKARAAEYVRAIRGSE
ncbi:hypothetical protein VTO42DRAFT_6057 [Malbranchea cinnamomea]